MPIMESSANGVGVAAVRSGKRAVVPAPRRKVAPRKARRKWTPCKRLAIVVGGVGCAVLALSLWHCTEALAMLTGSPLVLSLLLAIGIDCGMVGCELATLASTGKGKRWAEWYVGVAVALSMLLNSAGMGVATGQVLAYGVGLVIPVLVYMLAKVAGHLWTEG